ncbi:hypothetical protein F5144DRAFT_66918 [Chaetomium tenue]|uniref:Uncharacterized protein n=1 Tax=Chaetomium tenue TaxID=1854479 RepID=A0ACB7PRF3_9PEZI|nr:hypothetical protein F5144DRAFT_66918 [Chaetomium globosum]
MAPQTQTFKCFFDLPVELREQILSYICIFPTDILVGSGPGGRCVARIPAAADVTQHGDQDQRHDYDDEAKKEDPVDYDYADPPTNLFLASPLLYREAGDLYYTRNTFLFPFILPSSCSPGRRRTRHRSPHRPRHQQFGVDALLRLLTHPDTTNARRRIRAAVVVVRDVGTQLQNVIVPALTDMVLSGALRRLCVDVMESAPPSGPLLSFKDGPGGELVYSFGDGVGDGGTNPALRALLALLADPGLSEQEQGGGVKLRVLRGWHEPFWCQFHEQTSPSSSSAAAAVGSGEADGERGGAAGAVSCAMLGGRIPSSEAAVAAVTAAVMAAALAAGERNGGGVGDDEFLELDIDGLVDAVGVGDAAEFNIKKA